ncbi:MAG: hypothetical protein JWM80_2359 [Cyanobacteria bacterium RYN_339]|nr:hypothetical protein [Cyanobacteria bacterium RYN_339]
MTFLERLFKRAKPPKPARRPAKSELHRRIRRLEIKTLRLVHTIFGGEYQSVFKGRGIEFDEVREYQEGDDPRLIDWNVTARMDRLFVKKFVEERELSIVLVVDVSASHAFGSQAMLKRELAAELACALAMSALQNHDQVGLVLFSDRIERFVKPKKGRGHVNRLVREILDADPAGKGTDYRAVVDFVMQLIKHRSVVFFISDFLTPGFEKPLRLATTRHDVIPVVLADPRERSLPDVGLVRLDDPETGESVVVDTGSAKVRKEYARQAAELRAKRIGAFRALGLDFLELATDQSYVKPLIKFFQARQTRRGKSRRGA